METIKLSFNAEVLGHDKSITFEIPYSDGVVATSRFCPMELLNSDVELLAALNGESLEGFVKDCKMQLQFANEAKKDATIHEAFIAGLMASVMAHYAHKGKLSTKDYLLHMDAFSYLLFASGISEEQVGKIYPRILDTIIDTIESQSRQ